VRRGAGEVQRLPRRDSTVRLVTRGSGAVSTSSTPPPVVDLHDVAYKDAMSLRAPLRLALTALVVVPSLVACGDDAEGTGGAGGTTGTASGTGGDDASTGVGGAGGDDLVVNECGTFDPNQVGDSVIPDDPTDPAIVASCEAFCDAFASACESGGFVRDDCVDDCRLRACGICPGSIQSLVECETAESDVATCTCQDGVPVCASPESCGDEEDATYQCGG
jgi:hypothetical protein